MPSSFWCLVGTVHHFDLERDDFQPIDVRRFAYAFTAPGVFVQDDVDLARWLAVSASARLDRHSEFGTFFSPRISGLLRHGPWSSRVSYGAVPFADRHEGVADTLV